MRGLSRPQTIVGVNMAAGSRHRRAPRLSVAATRVGASSLPFPLLQDYRLGCLVGVMELQLNGGAIAVKVEREEKLEKQVCLLFACLGSL